MSNSHLAILTTTLFLCAGPSLAADGPGVDPNSKDSRDAWVLPDLMGNIYAKQCAVCHGDALQGAAQGPSLLMQEYLHGDSVPEIVASIDKGFPDKGMPAWSKVLSPEEVRGIAIYVLEQRDDNDYAVGNGTGPPPVVPTDIQRSEHHAFTLQTVATGIEHPYSIAPLPDDRILLGEKSNGLSIVSADGSSRRVVTGTPKFYKDGKPRGTTYTGNGWLLDIALHPEYADNGWVYLSYGDRCQDCNAASRESGEPVSMIHLIRGRIQDGVWKDQESIWRVDRKHYRAGHELGIGARIAFDTEGHVYLSLGGIGGYAGMQDLDSPYGKVHRVHDDGRIPIDNPHVDVEGALPSTWTVGHRNPQGMDFDPHTGRLWGSEHGPRGGDESNILLPGRNYGWPLVSLGVDYDGLPIRYAEQLDIEFNPADLTPATIDWTPSPGISSIVFYRGEAFPSWQNDMLVATLSQNDLYRVVTDEDGEAGRELLIEDLGRLRDVEVGAGGAIYLLVEHSAGSLIVRMEPADTEMSAGRLTQDVALGQPTTPSASSPATP
jgi:glucose/arabinose dehydrogenase